MFIGDEEQNGKQKQEEKNMERAPNQATMDHLVVSYAPHGSYGGPILKPPAHNGKINFIYIYMVGESGFRGATLVLFLLYMNVSGMLPLVLPAFDDTSSLSNPLPRVVYHPG